MAQKEFEVTATVREEKLVTYLIKARNQSIAEAMVLNQDAASDYQELSVSVSKRITRKVITTMETE